jgi:hypothetical protein
MGSWPRPPFRWLALIAAGTLPIACGGAPHGMRGAQAARLHAIIARIALVTDADGEHVTFPTQNGSTVSLAKSDIVGKTVLWGTAVGGDIITNADQVDKGIGTMAEDLTTTFATDRHYADGPWEVATIISVSGVPPPDIPAPGDLAALDDTTPPPGDPPVTGVSIRLHVKGADAEITLTNRYFLHFGSRP